MAGIRPGSP
uniref:Uncharacterized protein n=1 Tax=Timema poppense TaxID=170557 RepID=A0A7R9HGP8_TIMPO|nr:unnamed protein product [Timema poppensis]